MWYNFDLLKKQHSFIHHTKEAHVSYVQIEHVSGNLVIGISGNKSGMEYETSDLFRRHTRERKQASYLTMRIYLKNRRNALPEIKCCRDHYGINGTTFVIHDKKLADEVLTHLFKDYDSPEDMKEYLLAMFDDWENLTVPKVTAYPISENIIVGNIVSPNKKRISSFGSFFRRLFSCGSNWNDLNKSEKIEDVD